MERFSSGFTLIHKESEALLFGQRDGFTLSQMECWGHLINEHAVIYREASNPRGSLHLCGAWLSTSPDHDLLIDGIRNREVADNLMQELQSAGARKGEDRAYICNDTGERRY